MYTRHSLSPQPPPPPTAMVAAASPSAVSPSATVAAVRLHPPYKEMILRAVEYLSDRRGSSRSAIAKFISAAYSDLPPAHDALLFIHLRRLKSQGLLSMINHSYCLPAAAAAAAAAGGSSPIPNSATSLPKRPRGRPRKTPLSNPKPLAVGRRKRGRPRKMTVIADAAAASVGTEKRKRGRPRSVLQVDADEISELGIVSDPLIEKRKRGRPRKTATVPSPTMGEDGEVAGDVEALQEKRKRGRPRKTALLLDLVADSIGTEKRKHGRPRRVAQAATDSHALLGLTKISELGIGSDPLIEKGNLGKLRKVEAVSSPATVEDEEVAEESTGPPAVLGLAETLEHGFGSGSVCGAAKSLIEMRRSGQPKNAVAACSPAMVELDGSEIPGTVKASVEKRKPGGPTKFVQFCPNLVPAVVAASKRKPGWPTVVVQPGLNPTAPAAKLLVYKRKRGRPRKISLPALQDSLLQLSGKVVESVEKRKRGRPRKAVVEVQPGYGSMPHPVSISVEKRKPGRPRKVLASTSSVMAIDGSAELLSLVSLGKVVDEVEVALDPVPVAMNLSVFPNEQGMSGKASTCSLATLGDDNDTMLNPMQQSSKKAAREVKEGVDPNVSVIDCIGQKDETRLPAFLNSTLLWSEKVAGEFEAVMPSI